MTTENTTQFTFSRSQKRKIAALARAMTDLATEVAVEKKTFPNDSCIRADGPVCAYGHALAKAGFQPDQNFTINITATMEFLGFDDWYDRKTNTINTMRLPQEMRAAINDVMNANDEDEGDSDKLAASLLRAAAIFRKYGSGK